MGANFSFLKIEKEENFRKLKMLNCPFKSCTNMKAKEIVLAVLATWIFVHIGETSF